MDLQELKKYRAIPWGMGIFFGDVAFLILVSVGLGFLLEMGTSVATAWMSAGALFVFALGVVALSSWTLFVGCWRRNVRGYNAWCWRDEDRKIQVSFTQRG
jgi:hypothetical protein